MSVILTDGQWQRLGLGVFALAVLSCLYLAVRGSLRMAADRDWPSPHAMRSRLAIRVARRGYTGVVAATGALVFAPSLLIMLAVAAMLTGWWAYLIITARREAVRYPDREDDT